MERDDYQIRIASEVFSEGLGTPERPYVPYINSGEGHNVPDITQCLKAAFDILTFVPLDKTDSVSFMYNGRKLTLNIGADNEHK